MRPAHSTHLTRELPLAGVDVDALQLVVVPASPDQQVLVSPTIMGRREPDSSVGKIRYGLYRDEVLLAEGILPVGTQESPSVPISFPVADTPATVDRVTYTLRLRNTEDSGDTYASQGLSLHVEPVSGALEFVGERRGRIAATPDTPVVTIDRTGTSLDVGWSSAGATEFRYRERYGTTTGDRVVTTGDSVTLTNRVRRRTYHYDVQARRLNSPWSATGTESVTIPAAPTTAPPPPAAPTVNATLAVDYADGESRGNATWNRPSRTTYFEYQLGFDGSRPSNWTRTTSTSASDSSSSVHAEFTARVRACNSGGCSNSDSDTAVASSHPPQPSNPSVSIAKTSAGYKATLSWGAPPGATGYEYRGVWQDGSVEAGTTTDTSKAFATGKHVCDANIKFTGEVLAVYLSTVKSSSVSASDMRTNDFPVPVPSPVSVTIAKTSAGYEATLSWGEVAEASGYEYRGAWQGESLPNTWSSSMGTSVEFTTSKHVCDVDIDFTGEVRAVCPTGRTSASVSASDSTPNTHPIPAPSVSVGTIATTSTGYEATLSWDGIDGVPKYEYRGAWQGASLPNTWSATTGTSVEFTTGKHVCDATIEIECEVRAVCPTGRTSASVSASDSTPNTHPIPTPSVSVGTIATTSTGYEATLSWDGIDGVPKYEYRGAWQGASLPNTWSATTGTSVEFTTGKHVCDEDIDFEGEVRAVCSATKKGPAGSASATRTGVGPDAPPVTVSPIAETYDGDGRADGYTTHMSWPAVDGVTTYEYQYTWQSGAYSEWMSTTLRSVEFTTGKHSGAGVIYFNGKVRSVCTATLKSTATSASDSYVVPPPDPPGQNPTPETQAPPTTRPPTTRPPTTRPPTTRPPTTRPPTTRPPTTRPPTTRPPTTRPPTTRPPTTRPPTTRPPTTRPPTTRPPTTRPPTTRPPTTRPPTTRPPVTQPPTVPPWRPPWITLPPTTRPPTTRPPTTRPPTTRPPTTRPPVTQAPTTQPPTEPPGPPDPNELGGW